MATLQTVPPEIHHHITEFLFACDVAALALSCRTLKRRLGHENQFFWYNRLHKRDEDIVRNFRIVIKSKPDEFQPEDRDYWAEATGILSGKSDYGCRSCLATPIMEHFAEYHCFAYFPVSRPGVLDDGERLRRRYCHACFLQWHIELDSFTNAHSTVPLPAVIGIRVSREDELSGSPLYDGASLKRFIPITTAIKAIEASPGLKFEIANSIPHRFRARWSRARGEYDAQLVDGALNFLKDIYRQKYKHLHVVISPDAYYKRFSDSLARYILLNYPAADRENAYTLGDLTMPPLSIAEKVIKISRLLIQGAKEQSMAAELADDLHVRLFCRPDKFEVQTLTYPCVMVLKADLSYSCFGMVTRPIGVFTWHILYTYLYFNSKPTGYERRCIRCYWCLRQNNGRDTEDNRYDEDAADSELSERWIVVHNLVHHPELVRKRPRNKAHDRCTVLSGNNNIFMVHWTGTIYNDPSEAQEFRKERPVFENEELEDVPEGVLRFRGDRISTSRYFPWV
ncbi:hypothetical protein TWF506_010107 [Arthrobotrys conoides]|uniref:F-box domain-containing protein n=1 Tax=Arthrobotrys conoides TaxID=74498 RepID=A0AAN8NJT0_9PEZI